MVRMAPLAAPYFFSAFSLMRMTAAAKREAEIKAAVAGDELPPKSSKLWEWLKAAF